MSEKPTPAGPEVVLAALESMKTELNTKVDGLKAGILEEVSGMIPKATSAALQPLFMASSGDSPTRFKHLSTQDLSHLGDQMKFILTARKSSFRPDEAKAMGLTIGEDGGFAVPPEFKAEILRKLPKESMFRALCQIYPGVSKKGTINKEAGTIEMSYEGEVTPDDETVDATGLLGQIAWDLKKLYGLTYLSNDLIRFQQIDMLNYLADRYSIAIMANEDDVFLNGDGSKRPLGIRRYRVGANTLARDPARALWKDMRKLKHKVPVQYRNKGVWLVHNDVIELLSEATDSTNKPLWRELGDVAASAQAVNMPPQTVGFFDGRPVIENNNIPLTMLNGDDTGGNKSEIIFTAPQHSYAIFEDGAWEMVVNDAVRFKQDQLAVRVKQYHDGKPTITEATGFLTAVETA